MHEAVDEKYSGKQIPQPMARTIAFVFMGAVLSTAILVVEGAYFAGLLAGWVLLPVVAFGVLVSVPVVRGVTSLVDRWAPAFRTRYDRLDGEVPPNLSADLESETDLDARWGHHFHPGGGVSEEPWTRSPLACQSDYVQDWVAALAPVLLNEVGVAHMLEERGNIVRVVIPRIHDSGFEITVEAATFGVLVRTETLFHAHFHFDPSYYDWPDDDWPDDDDDSEDDSEPGFDELRASNTAAQALGLVRDLLSPAVRIRERRAAGIPYYAALETRVGGEWRRRRAVALLRFPYLGPREERVSTNSHLAPRTGFA